jgi:class 3 adenylate cyclase
MIELLKQINDDVKNIFERNLETTKAYVVPSRADQGLTFAVGDDKKGKLIETCVLFVDMRNSTQISNSMRTNKNRLGKIYSAFVHSMTTIADEFGYVRNIVGDRVMVVFKPDTCFNDAIHCATMMNTVATRIIKRHSGIMNFKVGIGIDFGEMLVLKTGIPKKYQEQSEYKGLVWVGNAANFASKLTDAAGKEFTIPTFQITYSVLVNSAPFIPFQVNAQPTFLDIMARLRSHQSQSGQGIRRENKTIEVTADEFAINVSFSGGKIFYNGLELIDVQNGNKTESILPVLMTPKVFTEYRKINPGSILLRQISSKTYQKCSIGPVYGGALFHNEINQIVPFIGKI